MYLPQLGGGHKGGGGSGKSEENTTPQEGKTASAKTTTGVSYPATQAIVSNPPDPTNHVQTILQPVLPRPPALKTFVPLPNMVRLAAASPEPPPPGLAETPKHYLQSTAQPASDNHSIVPELHLPTLPPNAPPPLEAPKLTLPTQAQDGTTLPLQAVTRPPAPADAVVKPRPALPTPEALPGAGGADSRSLLALSAMPLSGGDKVPPPAEARGQFALAALPNLTMTNLGPGSPAVAATGGSVGVGSHSDTAAHNATGDGTANAGNASRSTNGSGSSGAGLSTGRGSGNVETTWGMVGTGAGSGAGSGVGRGSGLGSGSGTGAGAGPGAGPFPGITIQGGSWASGTKTPLRSHLPNGEHNAGSYGMTIVSSGNSGGGLGDFGVFHDEAVFTVYVDSSSSSDDPAPMWTLEYALLKSADFPRGGLEAPFPKEKQTPEWPIELATRYRGRLIVVYAVIDSEGKMRGLKVMQSPNIEFNQPLLAALENWAFRPAKINDTPVPVKALLGIPIDTAEGAAVRSTGQATSARDLGPR